MQELLRQAYLDGWQKSLSEHAWWKDGRQLIGSGRISLSEALQSSSSDIEHLFERWLERQKETYGRDE
jgi:hypothetical protein